MTDAIGRTTWAIAEGWIPPYSHGPEPAMTSHETACLLNTSDRQGLPALQGGDLAEQ